MPGFRLGLDEDFQMAGCFQELIHGYTTGLVEPYMMRGLQPLGPNRTTLEIIIPSQAGLTPEKWVGGWGPQYHASNRGRWAREGPGGR